MRTEDQVRDDANKILDLVDTETAKVVALVIFGRWRVFGFLGRSEDTVIRWENIKLIGEDTILVTHCPFRYQKQKKSKLAFFRGVRGAFK